MTENYSNIELVEMVRLCAISGNNLRQAVEMFVEMFPGRPRSSRAIMLAATQRLRDHGQFNMPRHAQGRGSVGL